jgi:hypothetical protein
MRRRLAGLISLVPFTILTAAMLYLAGCAAMVSNNNSDPPPPSGSDSITGAFIDDSTSQRVAGALVVLEQPDQSGIDRVLQSTVTAANGTFAFSGLSTGSYDLVADGSVTTSGSTVTYAATITLGVPVNSTLNGVPLVPQFGDSMPYGVPVDIGSGGLITESGNAAMVDVNLSPLQSALTQTGTILQVTIPALAGSVSTVTTNAGADCSSGTNCANFSLLVPSRAPIVGTYDSAQTSYTNPTTGPQEVVYTIEGRTFVHASKTPDCSPSSLTVAPIVPRGTIASKAPNLNFTGCQ